MFKKQRLNKDKGDSFGVLLTDLSKAFDCLSYELLKVKLAAHGFNRSVLKSMYNYLFDRKQKTRISILYSSWQDILSDIPQGSILGPLSFNLLPCDLFLVININNIDFESYADDNKPYTTHANAKKFLDKLEIEAKSLFKWFSHSQMKANPDKQYLLIRSASQSKIKIGNETIKTNSYFE